MTLPIISFRPEELEEYSKTEYSFEAIRKKYKERHFTEYLIYIERFLPNILVGNLNDLRVHKEQLNQIYDLKPETCQNSKPFIKSICFCQICEKNRQKKNFSQSIQDLLQYKSKRISKYFYAIQNKSCYICNAQYTIFAYKNFKRQTYLSRLLGVELLKKDHENQILQETTKQKFNYDHYFPKSIYPAFSVSLHNLFPICSSCNQIKTNNDYDLDNIHTLIKFKLDEQSVLDYYNKSTKLRYDIDDKTEKKIANIFGFKGIYDNHTDHLEELLERKIKYTKNYKKVLKKRFPEIVISEKIIEERLILGTYTDDIYKRPLSKFINDINNQLDNL